jgi:hypothetical protein
MVLRQVAITTLVGAFVGLVGALGVGKGAQSILFQMTGADPAVLALSAVALALVALCAGFIPAHRASRVDPMDGVEMRIACRDQPIDTASWLHHWKPESIVGHHSGLAESQRTWSYEPLGSVCHNS